MPVLSATNITKQFGIDVILDSLSFSIEPNHRIGIVGPNGAGKSTLLKIICGLQSPDLGDFFVSNDLSIGFLPQNTVLDSSETLMNEMYSEFKDVLDYEQKLRELEQSMSTLDYTSQEYEKVMHEYSTYTQYFEDAKGYEIDSRIKGALAGLNFTPDMFNQSINTFSGGQKTRAALCKMLVRNPDILLLDEPTNHLDLSSLQWLGTYLSTYNGTIIVVSHDRYLLDSICHSIYEISHRKLTIYKGNYSDYVKKKAAYEKDYAKHYALQQKEIKRQKNIIEKYRSFNREKSIKAAESREKQLNKMDVMDSPESMHHISLSFPIDSDCANEVLVTDCLVKSFDDLLLFNNVSFTVNKSERVGLIGANGTGKSTLLKILANTLSADTGSFSLGSRVSLGYFDQEHALLDPESSILDHVHEAFPNETELTIRNMLASLLFRGDDVYKQIKLLSGGEKSRVEFAKLMLGKHNFILLDEPTNHLDMMSREILENAFLNYEGTLLFVSHDRYFLNKIATRILYLDNQVIKDYKGNYDYYINQTTRPPLDAMASNDASNAKTKTQIANDRKKERELRQAAKVKKQRINELELLIESLDEKKIDIEKQLSSPETYENKELLLSLQKEYQSLEAEIDTAYNKWETLTEEE